MRSALANKKLGFVGLGNIGQAIVSGLLKGAHGSAEQMAGTVASEESQIRQTAALGIEVGRDNLKLARDCDVIILAVRWGAIDQVIGEMVPALDESKLIISLAGAMNARFIEERAKCNMPVVLAIPNSPCRVNAGITLLCGGAYATDDHLRLTESIFESLGSTVWVERTLLDSFISLTSSGPAYFYLIAEALAQAGASMGIPDQLALQVTAQAMLGAAQMLLQTNESALELRQAITTPGGCTIAGINEMEKGNVPQSMKTAATAATRRLGELRLSMGTSDF